ncbi:heat shock 70 kDa protein 15-like [Lotus japonicus]|uniref:heat shock 70 kDa protein 15-like n=1 Tax=Lotus japonicus TaxID=34305 RepID=UPI0025875330|nr:heat shock 70 kDa protein 15-like [Lotus japonicus]
MGERKYDRDSGRKYDRHIGIPLCAFIQQIFALHMTRKNIQKVLNECVEAENWLREKKQQDSLPKYANLVLLSAEIRKKAEAVDRFCKPIMTKPRPAKPATPQTPPTPPSKGGEQQQPQGDANANTRENVGDNGNQAPPASSEPMETDKLENSGST